MSWSSVTSSSSSLEPADSATTAPGTVNLLQINLLFFFFAWMLVAFFDLKFNDLIIPRVKFWCLSLFCVPCPPRKSGIPAFFSSRKNKIVSYLFFPDWVFLIPFCATPTICLGSPLSVSIISSTSSFLTLIEHLRATYLAKSVMWISHLILTTLQ